MKKAYLLGTCLLIGMTSSSFGSSELRNFENSLNKIKFIDEFLDSEPHGSAGVIWHPWEDAFKKAEIKYDKKNIKFIVLHYTASPTRKSIPDVFRESGTSSHFLVDSDGTCINYVDPYKGIAYHAGTSFFAGYSRLNYWSIGIEHTGLGYTSTLQYDEDGKPLPGRVIPGSNNYWYEFPEIQFQTSCELTRALQEKFKIPGYRVVAHADIAPEKQSDIGPMWNYKRAYDEYNVGYFPSETHQINMENFKKFTDDDYLSFIGCFGYDTAMAHKSNNMKVAVTRAYQYHYSQSNISGDLVDGTKQDILKHVVALVPNCKYEYFLQKLKSWVKWNPTKAQAFWEYF